MVKKISPDQLIANCSSWEDFPNAVADLTKLQKGDCFERLTQLYLLTKSEYRTSLKNVWIRSIDLPPRIQKKLSLPTTDEGIDLVAETRNGEFWAIQSKYRTDDNTPLTYTELSTFTNLTFNTCAGQFSQAVVVHTSSKPVKKRKLLGNTTEIGLQRWLEMTPDHWELIKKSLRKKPARPKRRTPRRHQKKAIKAAAKHFVKEKQSRGKLIMPCGTGKSLTAYWIAEELKAKTILLVVPSLALIKQGVEDWTQEIVACNEEPLPEWLCVCSDETTGTISKDEFVSETYDLGLPVTTDPNKIQRFLAKRSRKRRIVFVTYQSSPVFAKAALKAGVKFDLAVLDEAHKTAGNKSKAFATLLFDKNLQIKNRMFMTATERVMRGANDDVVSMDDVKDYGECFYHLSFKEAIHSEPAIISNYKILTLFVTEDEIKSVIKDKRFVTDRKHKIDAADSRGLAAAIALRKAYKKYRIKHAVSFHRSIQSASDFSDLHRTLNEYSNLRPMVDCFHISSKKTAGQRTRLLKEFAESGRSLITNARCLTEGVDVPAIDCVLFADPKQSTIDIVQAAGRSLRPYAGKKCGYIMLPIIVPDGMAIDEFAESTEFRAVSKVITALSTQDERIAEEFKVVDRGKRLRGGIIQFDGTVPVGMNVDFRQFADAISVKVWERTAKVNQRAFEEARNFSHKLGFTTKYEWAEYAQSSRRPKDIPSNPRVAYMGKGWQNWGDWLGTGNIATFLRVYLPFEEAREYVRSLGLKNTAEWKTLTLSGELPANIPSDPRNVYKEKGWKGMSDWLGNGFVGSHLRQFRSFKSTREFARALEFEREDARNKWKKLSKEGKLPEDIPADPYRVYKSKGWISWPDFFGYAPRPFKAARSYARSLGLKSAGEWNELVTQKTLPRDIPKSPKSVYKHVGWKGWPDFLGYESSRPQNIEWRLFKNARKYIHSRKLGSQREWNDFKRSGMLPEDIPKAPHEVYKGKGWKGIGDWLGTFSVAPQNKEWRPFKKARKYVRNLELKSRIEWEKFKSSGKLPDDIPRSPNTVYKNLGWVDLGDWLGTGRVASRNRKWRPFEEAREFARALGLSDRDGWREYCKRQDFPEDIPKNPGGSYAKEWKGWGDWLGTFSVAWQNKEWRPFEEAREFARALGLSDRDGWREYCKRQDFPKDIPKHPPKSYAKEWKGWGDWLGTGRIANQNRKWRPFQEARKFAHSLDLSGKGAWAKYCKRQDFPKDIPKSPPRSYAKEWISWPDWLGNDYVATYLRDYRSFKSARMFARELQYRRGTALKQWKQLSKEGRLPDDIPADPSKVYKGKGWTGWPDFFGYAYRSFEEARLYARGLGLNVWYEWLELFDQQILPRDLPKRPESVYLKDGWDGWADFLDSGGRKRPTKYREFEAARKFAQSLNFTGSKYWREFAQSKELPIDIPKKPESVYKKHGWKGYPDWLGY